MVSRYLGGLAVGAAIPFGAIGSAAMAPAPLTDAVRAAVERLAPQGPRRAQVAVVFGADGRVVASAVVRSTGSSHSDETAREGALQLAALEPPGAVAGRTLVFGAVFD